MKAIIPVVLLAISAVASADDSVNGYTRRDGTNVAPHMRSEPNGQRFDNYSSQGNSNPYTGQSGHQRNEFSSPPVYNHPRPVQQPIQNTNPYSAPRPRRAY